jgi:WD40 repeat protein
MFFMKSLLKTYLREFHRQFLGSVTGIIGGLVTLFICLRFQQKGINMVPLSVTSIHYLLLLFYSIILLAVSFFILLKPKKLNSGVGIGFIALVTISIPSNIVLSFVNSSFLFARVNRDADGYTRYAAYLNNHRDYLPEGDFYPSAASPTSPSVAFDPSGQIITIGNRDGTISIWNNDGTPRGSGPYQGHKGAINSIAFGPGGELLVSGGHDGTVRLWNCQGQSIGEPFRDHMGQVYSVAFSPNGKYIASGGHDGTVRLLNRQGVAVGTAFYGHKSSVTTITFSPDGDLIASGSADSTIRIWDLNGNLLSKPLEGLNVVSSIAFSPDGKFIAGAGEMGFYAALWDRQGNLVTKIPLVNGWVFKLLAFSPEGKSFVTANGNGKLQLWDYSGNAIGDEFAGVGGSITSIAFKPDGRTIACGCSDGNVYLWKTNGELIKKISQKIRQGDKGSKSHFYRSLGYPLILSAFMRLTGQYNSVAAAICQPVILTIVVILCMLWAWRKFGLPYAIALAIPFLDPSNELAKISTYDYADPLLCILSLAIILLVYKVILSNKNTKYYFLLWLTLTFIAASMKIIMCIIVLIVCFSFFLVLCIGKISNAIQFNKYSLPVTSKRLAILILSTIVIAKVHTYMAPGAAIFNKQAGLINCYWIPAPDNGDPLMKKIKQLQELSDEKYGHLSKVYAGAGLTHSVNGHPSIKQVLPILGQRSIPFVDTNSKQVLELTTEEFERGAYSLITSNPFPLIRIGIEHGLKDYKNMFLFSSIAKKSAPLWAMICTIFLLVGIFSLYRYNNLVTMSLCVAYILFLCFICMTVTAATKYVLPFIGFYYIAFVCGAVCSVNGVKKLLILFR